MEFTDRMMAVDRSVAAYRRFTHGDLNSIAIDLIADLLHWHNRFILDGSLTVDEATNIAMMALEHFEAERVEALTAENPLRGHRVSEFVVDDAPRRRSVPRRPQIIPNGPESGTETTIRHSMDSVEMSLNAYRSLLAMHEASQIEAAARSLDDPDVTIDF